MIAWNCKVVLTGVPTWGTWTPGAVYLACMFDREDDVFGYFLVDNEGTPGRLTRNQARVVEPASPLPAQAGGGGQRIAPAQMIVNPGVPTRQ